MIEYFLYGMLAGIGLVGIFGIITIIFLFKPKTKIDDDLNVWGP